MPPQPRPRVFSGQGWGPSGILVTPFLWNGGGGRQKSPQGPSWISGSAGVPSGLLLIPQAKTGFFFLTLCAPFRGVYSAESSAPTAQIFGGHFFLDPLEPFLSSCLRGTPHSVWMRVEVTWVVRLAPCTLHLQCGSGVSPSLGPGQGESCIRSHTLVGNRLPLWVVPLLALLLSFQFLPHPQRAAW